MTRKERHQKKKAPIGYDIKRPAMLQVPPPEVLGKVLGFW